MVNWEEMVPNKSVLDQVNIFRKTLMNVFSNFIPEKLQYLMIKIPYG